MLPQARCFWGDSGRGKATSQRLGPLTPMLSPVGMTGMLRAAGIAMGRLCLRTGDLRQSHIAFLKAANSGHDAYAGLAEVELAMLALRAGDLADGEERLRRLLEASEGAATVPDELVLAARLELGRSLLSRAAMLDGEGSARAARRGRELLEAVVVGPDRLLSAVASLELGRWAARQGAYPLATSLLQSPADYPDKELAGIANVVLGMVHTSRGDGERACLYYVRGLRAPYAVSWPALTHAATALCRLGQRRVAASLMRTVAPATASMSQPHIRGQHTSLSPATSNSRCTTRCGSSLPEPLDLPTVGGLLAGLGDEDGARQAWEAAVKSLDSTLADRARLRLSMLAAQQGRTEEALEGFENLAEKGSGEEAHAAVLSAAMLLWHSGDLSAAEQRLRRLVDADSRYATRAALNLGAMLTAQGRNESALTAYRQALNSPEPAVAAAAAANLGDLHRSVGGNVQAAEYYRQAMQGPEPRSQQKAADGLMALVGRSADEDGIEVAEDALMVGGLLAGLGDEDGARQAWEAAVKSLDSTLADRARLRLSMLAAQQGRTEEALEGFENLAEKGSGEEAHAAVLSAAMLLWHSGDLSAAEQRLRRLVDADSRYATRAALNLGAMLTAQGRNESALTAYRQALNSPEPAVAAAAAANLGDLHRSVGGNVQAAEYYRQAMQGPEPRSQQKAADGLMALVGRSADEDGIEVAEDALMVGGLLAGLGDEDGARQAWEAAVKSLDSTLADRARLRLSMLAAQQGRTEEALEGFENLAEKGSGEEAHAAVLSAAMLLWHSGDLSAAEQRLRRLVDADSRYATRAALNLGAMLTAQGRNESALTAYRQALNSPEPAVAAAAAANLQHSVGLGHHFFDVKRRLNRASDSQQTEEDAL